MSGWAFAGLVSLGVLWNTFLSEGSGAARSAAQRQTSQESAPLPNAGASLAKESTAPQEVPDQVQVIDDAQRQYLWQVEHHGNLLAEHGFPAVAQALREVDAEALGKLLAPDFTGEIPSHPEELSLDSPFAHVQRLRDAGQPPTTLDRGQFVTQLLDYRRLLKQPPEVKLPLKIKLALMGFSPTVRGDLDSVWQGTCQLRMWGETEPGQPGDVVVYLQYVVLRPSEEVFRQGGWLRSCAITQSQVARAPHFLFRDVASERGIRVERLHDNWLHRKTAGRNSGPTTRDTWRQTDSIAVTGGVYVSDYDRDGILDMLITDVNGFALYQGEPGGKFADVTADAGLLRPLSGGVDLGPSFVAAFVDLDGDGWEDLVLGNSLFRNVDGRQFVDVTARSNLRMTPSAGGIVVADYDRDGWLDLYVTVPGMGKADSWVQGKNGMTETNQLWRNLGNWRFQNVTGATGAAGGHRSTFSAVWFDVNNDNWPDLYVINEFGNGVLLVNQGNELFVEQLLVDRPSDFGSMGLTCGDIDNDGRIDLYVANMYSKAGNRVIGNLRPDSYPSHIMAELQTLTAGSQLYRNLGGLKFDRLGAAYQVADVGWSYGPALADLDNDGWLDLHSTCGFISRDREKPDG